MTAGEFGFGQRVTFTRTLERRYQEDPSAHGHHRWLKVWVADRWPGAPEPPARSGIVVGVRTLSNGYNTGGDWEDPIIYHAAERFRAYLVAFDMHRRPVLVLPEDIKP